MNTKAYIKELLRLALPTTLGNIFTFLIGFTDHIMTSPLGKAAIGGIFLSNQVGILLQFIITGIEATVTVLCAREDAEGKTRAFNKTFMIALYSALGVAILTTVICFFAPSLVLSVFSSNREIIDTGTPFLRILALSFIPFSLSRIIMTALRAKKLPRPSLYLPLITFIINFLLNLLFIGGERSPLSLGAVGAALATLISRTVELSLGAFLLFKEMKPKISKGSYKAFLKSLKIPLDTLKLFIKAALPILIGQVAWAANNFLTTALLSKAGEGSAVAAFGAASSVHNLAYTLMNGTSSAIGVLTSRSVGEGRLSYKACRTGELSLVAVGLFGSLLIFILSPPVFSLYHISAGDLSFALSFSRVFIFSFPLTTYSAGSLFGIIKSSGDVRFVSRVDTLLFLLLTLPTSLIAYAAGAVPTVLLLVLKLVDLTKCPIAYLYIKRRFMPRLTNTAVCDKI